MNHIVSEVRSAEDYLNTILAAPGGFDGVVPPASPSGDRNGMDVDYRLLDSVTLD